MVDANEPPLPPRKGTGKPRPATTPKPTRGVADAPPADHLMDELKRDLQAAGGEAFDALRSIGTGHVSPALPLNKLSLIIATEIRAIVIAHRVNDPDRHVRYGRMKQVLADMRDGKPVVMPFGVPRSARSAVAATPATPGAAAAQATVADVLKKMAALDSGKTSQIKGSATFGYSVSGSKSGDATGHDPHPVPPRRPVVDPAQPAASASQPETQADGGAGNGPPVPPPGLPVGRPADPEKGPDRRQGLVIDWRKGTLTDKLKNRARDTVVQHRRTIKRTTLHIVVLSVLGLVTLGTATFGAIVGGVSDGIFSVLTTWMTYRLAAGLVAIFMLAWLMDLTPSEFIAPPRSAWLPAILAIFCAVYAAGGTEIVGGIIAGALNTPLDSFTLKVLAAMTAASLFSLVIVRWRNAFPEIDLPRDAVTLLDEAFNGGRYGRSGRQSFREKKPFGDSGIGGDSDGDNKDRLNDVLSGRRGFDNPKFKD